jgi:hypothetical protein
LYFTDFIYAPWCIRIVMVSACRCVLYRSIDI